MSLIEIIFHLDGYITQVLAIYHNYFYLLLFIVIFCETGLVITPFLPGDSLLFVAGAIAAVGHLNIFLLVAVTIVAAFCGDNTNFLIGRYLGCKLFKNPQSKIFRQDLLKRSHDFYQQKGAIAIILARFVPLLRTFMPFSAGISNMSYWRFILFSLISTFLWVILFLLGGYFLGNLAFIKTHLSLIILVVIIVSLLLIIYTLRL